MSFKPIKMPSGSEDSKILRIAVELSSDRDKPPELIEFDQTQPLADIIKSICETWNIPDHVNYALQISDSNKLRYVTENNRKQIQNGLVLRLEQSPAKRVQSILGKINADAATSEKEINTLKKLSTLSSDIEFAREFMNSKGMSLIIKNIETSKYEGPGLQYILTTFIELMDHGTTSWNILHNKFIDKIIRYVNNQASRQQPKIIRICLSILENIILNTVDKSVYVEKEITIPSLITHLENKDKIIQQNTIALINAMFNKADLNKKQTIAATLCSRQIRNKIFENVIVKNEYKNLLGTELAYQLYILQTNILGLLKSKMEQRADTQEQESQEKIRELRSYAFENEICTNNEVVTRREKASLSRHYKKLGFKSTNNPIIDFNEAPPGILALDCILYFARNYREEYTKIVLRNSCRADEQECPFGQTSVELVKLLCDILHIGEPPSEQGQTYHPLFFTHDHPFEEIFCICIVLSNKTWKEMKATTEDLNKVLSVIREQITRALAASPTCLDIFRTKIMQLTYNDVTILWQRERTLREMSESHARPIVELREKITPEIINLIRMQRLDIMVKGMRFKKYMKLNRKYLFWFVRLSPNHKMLHYGQCDEKQTPSLEELGTKLAIADIKCVVIGKECPHMKELKGKIRSLHLAFSLILKEEGIPPLDFIAPDEQVFDHWTDGINALLKKDMLSKSFKDDLKSLLFMEIKIRLLDADGLNIPQDPPEVPPEPEDYDFLNEDN